MLLAFVLVGVQHTWSATHASKQKKLRLNTYKRECDVPAGAVMRYQGCTMHSQQPHLGVSVMSLEGQLLSQKPHSMQRSTSSLARGDGFRNFLCASGSLRVGVEQQQRNTADEIR